jgi:RimJ/RimL family protein N-acetyltransferase
VLVNLAGETSGDGTGAREGRRATAVVRDADAPMPFIGRGPIYLRPLTRADLNDTYLGWLNDPDVTRYVESGTFPYSAEELAQFYDSLSGSRTHVLLAIADAESHRHIGNVKLGPIDWVHRSGVFGIMIGDRRYWGRGYGTLATRLMVEYGFYRLNLNRIALGVYAEHDGAVNAYRKVGFKVEGVHREEVFHEGEYKDRLWMALLRREYVREDDCSSSAPEAEGEVGLGLKESAPRESSEDA